MPQTPVDIWTIALDTNRPAVLSAEEQARAARFHFERDRVRWSGARSALRVVLAGYLDTEPLRVQFSYGEHGKPSVEGGIHFNISHSGDWAMIAVARDFAVGIDIERVRADVEIANLLRRIGEEPATSDLNELFQMWTRREAKTKALGLPLMEIPTGDLNVVRLRAPEGYQASVAMDRSAPEVVYRRFLTNNSSCIEQPSLYRGNIPC